jgi:hypothetical protein
VTQIGNRAWPKIFRWLIAISLCCAGGFFVLFTTWAPYDDEGYILWTLIHQSQSHILYDEIFTQYGPAFYWLDSTLRNILPFPRTSDGQRWQTLFFWLAITSIAIATLKNLVVQRFENQSLQITLFFLSSFGLIFWHLDRLAMEPGHPQNWCTLLTVLLLWLLSSRESKSSIPFSFPRCLLMGTICGILMMIKPNVGILAVAGLPASLLWNAAPYSGRLLKFVELTYTIGLCSLPWLIMHRQLGNVSNCLHPLLVTISLLIVRKEYFLQHLQYEQSPADSAVNSSRFAQTFKQLLGVGIGATIPCIAFTLWTLEHGSQLSQFRYALFGQHQTLMQLYYYPAFQSAIPWLSATVAFILLITLQYRFLESIKRFISPNILKGTPHHLIKQLESLIDKSAHLTTDASHHRMFLIGISLCSLFCLIWTIFDSSTALVHGLKPRGIAGFLLAAMPWISWLWIRQRYQEVRVNSRFLEPQIHNKSRTTITALPDPNNTNLSMVSIVILQTMIAFPVPGTQLALGTLGLLILGLDIARTTLRDLCDRFLILTASQRRLSLTTCGSAALFLILLLPFSVAAGRYYSREPLQLAGAGYLRLSAENTQTTRQIVKTIQDLNVDAVVFQWHNRSSWLLWANRKPLGYALPPSWPYLLNAQQQQISFETMRSASLIAVIDEDYGPQVAPAYSILQDTWQKESQSVRSIGEFEIKLWRPAQSSRNSMQQSINSTQADRG